MSRSRSGPVTSRSTSFPPCGSISFMLFPSFVDCFVAGRPGILLLHYFSRLEMYSALSLNRSPPAAGARNFANLHGRGARRAADGRVAVVVKRVVGNVVPGYVIPDIAGGPGGERVDFDKPKLLIALDHAHLRT